MAVIAKKNTTAFNIYIGVCLKKLRLVHLKSFERVWLAELFQKL